MFVDMKQFFVLPVFVDDEENRLVGLLELVLLVILVGVALYVFCLFFFASVQSVHAWLISSIFLSVAVIYQLVRKSQLHLAAALLVGWLWLFTTIFILADADDAISFNPYVICIFLAGLLLGERWGIYCAVVSIVTSLSILWADANQLLPSNLLAHTPLVASVAQLIAYGMVTALLHFAAKSLTTALARASHNEQALKEANQALLARAQELERKEIALQASEARYRQLVEVSPAGIFVIQKNKIIYSNPAGLRLLGATELAELVGRSAYDFIHVDYQQSKQAMAEQLLSEGATIPFHEQKALRLDGEVIDVEFSGIAYRNQDGLAKQFIMYDIGARKRVEEKNTQLLATLKTQSVQLRALYHRLAETQEIERKRLAHELHDRVGQNLTVLSLTLNIVRTHLQADVADCKPIRTPLDEAAAFLALAALCIGGAALA